MVTYINDNGGQQGPQIINVGWGTPPGGEQCVPGDRVVWDATPGVWRLIKDAGNIGGVVQEVQGGDGIIVNGSQVTPVVNSDFGGDDAWEMLALMLQLK